ncbi:type II secretion system protein M [Paenalcaligenes suwonensis]|uniref:type II secretion system protein M n=1 Tax=Paenalcaligenes suwonensis TaxID=1202713 RepID=UPI00140A2783|nr:type II secretion system protein M [Paenalcaligenes suwonensis]NHC62666.1 hypothetical protein [Paenalcaligenes suwonensis]
MKATSSLALLRQQLHQRLRPLLHSVHMQWQRQTPRERLRARILLWCLPFLVLGYMAFQQWQLLQQQHQQLRVARHEFTQLQELLGQPAPSTSVTVQYTQEELHNALQNSLQTFSTQQAVLSAMPNQPTTWQLRLQQAPASDTLVWLLHTPAALNLSIVATELSRARVEGREQAGVLSGIITLQYNAPTSEGVSQS